MVLPQSLASILLIILSISSVFTTAHATQPSIVVAAVDDNLSKACSMTTYPGDCVPMLQSTPEIKTASPNQVALAAFKYVVKEGKPLVMESQRELTKNKDEAIKPCLTVLDTNLKTHVKALLTLTPEQSDVKFREARDVLNRLLNTPTNAGDLCMDAYDKNPVVAKILNFKGKLQVTGDLMENAQPTPLPLDKVEKKDTVAIGKKE